MGNGAAMVACDRDHKGSYDAEDPFCFGQRSQIGSSAEASRGPQLRGMRERERDRLCRPHGSMPPCLGLRA